MFEITHIVLPEAFTDETEYMRGKRWTSNPRQNEKSLIVDDKEEILLSSRRVPSNKLISCLGAPGCGAEEEAGKHPLMAIINEVGQGFPRASPITEVMIVVNQTFD